MARILLVEDDDTARDYLRIVMTRAGHTVLEASDQQSGLDSYRTHSPDLVLVDLSLSQCQGVLLIIQLQTSHPDANVVAMFGRPSADRRGLTPTILMRPIRVLARPFDHVELLRTLQEVLGTTAQPQSVD